MTLEVLFPQGKEVQLQGQTFNITPFKLGQLPVVLKAIQKIIQPIKQAEANGNFNDPAFLMGLIVEAGDDVIQLFSTILNRPIEFVQNFEMDESVNLVTAMIEVNSDFFSKRVQPLLHKNKI